MYPLVTEDTKPTNSESFLLPIDTKSDP